MPSHRQRCGACGPREFGCSALRLRLRRLGGARRDFDRCPRGRARLVRSAIVPEDGEAARSPAIGEPPRGRAAIVQPRGAPPHDRCAGAAAVQRADDRGRRRAQRVRRPRIARSGRARCRAPRCGQDRRRSESLTSIRVAPLGRSQLSAPDRALQGALHQVGDRRPAASGSALALRQRPGRAQAGHRVDGDDRHQDQRGAGPARRRSRSSGSR